MLSHPEAMHAKKGEVIYIFLFIMENRNGEKKISGKPFSYAPYPIPSETNISEGVY